MHDAISKRSLVAKIYAHPALAALSLAAVCVSAEADTFTVNRTGDTSGPCLTTVCNIRQAIDAANATSATDTIVFNIPACGTRFINITGATLHLVHPVVIDGNTQPLCGDPIPGDRTSLIELRGP